MRKLSLLALILGGFGLAACRGGGSSSGDDTTGSDSGTTGDDVRIQDIQNDAMVSGTPVKIKGVVVTAIDTYGGKTGDFWIQEPDGGEFSGIHVFGAPLEQVSALEVGSVVDIDGAEKDEFVYSGNNGSGGFQPGYGITELKAVSGGVMTVSPTGAKMVLQPTPVDARMIAGIADYMARDAEWEKWEGVLIRVDNVVATTDQACVGSSCNDPTNQKVEITGGAVIESSLAGFPQTDVTAADAIKEGDCLGSVTGVLDYFFDYLLLPRATDEVVTTGGSCGTEDTAQLCGDGVDNDADGFSDCDDNGCIVAVASCRTSTTITAIQTAATPPTDPVELTDVRVVAVSANKKNMWVSTSLQAAPNEGMYIYGPGDDLSGFALGTKVNVIGRVSEFNNSSGTGTLTEIKALSVTAGAAGGGTTLQPVTDQTTATLTVDATGEPYESVLVTLNDVRITENSVACTMGAVPPACNYGAVDAKEGTTTFKMDDDILQGFQAGCYTTVTGVWTYFVYDDAWGFLPKTLGATGTSCPN